MHLTCRRLNSMAGCRPGHKNRQHLELWHKATGRADTWQVAHVVSHPSNNFSASLRRVMTGTAVKAIPVPFRSVSLSVCLSVSLSIYLAAYLYFYLSVYHSISVLLPVCLSVYIYGSLSLCLCKCISPFKFIHFLSLLYNSLARPFVLWPLSIISRNVCLLIITEWLSFASAPVPFFLPGMNRVHFCWEISHASTVHISSLVSDSKQAFFLNSNL